MPEIEIEQLTTLILLGLAAGGIGGLLGVGGSIVMIPVLTLVLRYDQHLSQAAAMIVNFFVTTPALLLHHRAGAVEWKLVRRMLPAGLTAIVIGVLVSNMLPGDMLKKTFGLFLVYVIYANLRRLVVGAGSRDAVDPRDSWASATAVGGITGFAAGLLGIGGGLVAVPLLQRICHLPLRRCIAASAAMMCLTSTVGATSKNLSLESLDLDATLSLLIAGCLAPTAIVGGLFGARLTHTLPLAWVRFAFIMLMAVAAVKLLF